MEAAQWWDMKGQTHLPGIVGKKLVGEKKTGVTWRRLKGSLCILNDIIYVVYINPFLYNVYVYIYMYITFVYIRSKRYCCLNIPNMAYPLWRVLSDKFSEGRNGEPLKSEVGSHLTWSRGEDIIVMSMWRHVPVRDQFHLVTWPFSKHFIFAFSFFRRACQPARIYRFSSHAGETHMMQGDGVPSFLLVKFPSR